MTPDEIVRMIFEHCGFETKISSTFKAFDFIARKDGAKYVVEVKSGRTIDPQRTIGRLIQCAEESNTVPILVWLHATSDSLNRTEQKNPNLKLVTLENLLYAVDGDSELRDELLGSLSCSLEDVVPEEGFLKSATLSLGNSAESFIRMLDHLPPGKADSSKYESLCASILKHLFSDKLALWKEQKHSNDDLYRFDLICRIKDNEKNTFWRILEDHFNSKYIIFEFKNYRDKITQKEIYTTDKYLYKKALRSTAIIVARNGFDRNSQWAAKGTLRENGKLILLLDNSDLKEMLRLKERGKSPSDYLLDKLDKLLLELEK